ncbi:hypothetical protein [Bdellovibrio sp. KM01]|uniref:hypothetical protein n=1 Tax=Bdellovibrio sp. KM01 TaxID=2748865 RepID=UPI0015E9F803|nr:hypothetical protein [Bdellovibrio sp. KM01]QLY24054.1 hypothetical protein HW988_11265 [Bdellovibrio sp. KM01]
MGKQFVPKKKVNFLFAGLWGVSLLALSVLSGFTVVGSVGDVNFEIATMLTPLGLFHILSADEHYLYPYLFQATQAREYLFSDLGFTASWVGFIAVASYLLIRLRKSHGKT